MELEKRYIVIKTKDFVELPDHWQAQLNEVLSVIDMVRRERGKSGIECIVIESDWPDYDKHLQMLADRVDGVPTE